MKRLFTILAYMCIAAAVIGLPVVLFMAMDKSGYLDTGDTGRVILAGLNEPAAVPTNGAAVIPPSPWQGDTLTVSVTASILEKRSKAGGGVNVGYWQEGDQIAVSWTCVSDTGDIWMAFAGGWSAAKFEGREFVNPLPAGTEVCDE